MPPKRLQTVTKYLAGAPHYHPSILSRLLRGSDRHTAVGFRDHSTDIVSDLEQAYVDEEDAKSQQKYSTMDGDKNRNEFFQQSIAEASTRVRTWLEIGPGASATLTRMVLSIKANKILAIEAVDNSAVSARKKVSSYNKRGPRAVVLHGLAGKVDLPPNESFAGLVAEVLGHVASNEGYVSILHECGAAYPALKKTLREAVPLTFGTKALPVSLKGGFAVAEVHSKLALLEAAFSAKNLLSASPCIVESYNALEELKRGPRHGGYRFSGSCTVDQGGRLDGFILYTFYGSSSRTIDVLGDATSNWHLVFLPATTPHFVGKGDVITFKSRMNVAQIEPSYEMRVLCGSHTHQFSFDYKDIVQKVVPVDYIHDVEKYGADPRWREQSDELAQLLAGVRAFP